MLGLLNIKCLENFYSQTKRYQYLNNIGASKSMVLYYGRHGGNECMGINHRQI